MDEIMMENLKNLTNEEIKKIIEDMRETIYLLNVEIYRRLISSEI